MLGDETLPVVAKHPRVRAVEIPFRRLTRAMKDGTATPQMAAEQWDEFTKARKAFKQWAVSHDVDGGITDDFRDLMYGLVRAVVRKSHRG